MPRIRFVNQYAGIIGGIERYMERTALLLRRNGFTVDCCYAEKTQVSDRFLAAFDHAETISDAIERNGSDYDLTVLHKVRDAEAVLDLEVPVVDGVVRALARQLLGVEFVGAGGLLRRAEIPSAEIDLGRIVRH